MRKTLEMEAYSAEAYNRREKALYERKLYHQDYENRLKKLKGESKWKKYERDIDMLERFLNQVNPTKIMSTPERSK
jgi:hypothetical protein